MGSPARTTSWSIRFRIACSPRPASCRICVLCSPTPGGTSTSLRRVREKPAMRPDTCSSDLVPVLILGQRPQRPPLRRCGISTMCRSENLKPRTLISESGSRWGSNGIRAAALRRGEQESCGSRILGHPSDGRSVGLGDPQVARAGNPTEPFQPLALSKQPAVKALKSVRDPAIWGTPVWRSAVSV